MNRRTLRTRLTVAAVSAPLALGLVACGGDDDSDDGNGVTSNPGTSEPSPVESSAPGESPAETPTETASGVAGTGTALSAAAAGLGAVEGGTVFAVDSEDAGGWEVSVVDAQGNEFDVRVGPDGNTLEGDPVPDTDDGDDATRDADERQRLLEVPLDYQAAVDAAASSGGQDVTGFELDEENGVATWEVTYDEGTRNELTVSVDAESGEISGTEQDD